MYDPGPEFTPGRRTDQFEGISTLAVHVVGLIGVVAAAAGVLPRWLLPVILMAWYFFGREPQAKAVGPVEGLLMFNEDPAERDPNYYDR